LQQPLQPPLPELLQLVLQQLPVVPPRQEPRPEPELPEAMPPAVRAVLVRVATPVRLRTLMQSTKSSKTNVAVAAIAGESGDVVG
jgi:hypothetical protein